MILIGPKPDGIATWQCHIGLLVVWLLLKYHFSGVFGSNVYMPFEIVCPLWIVTLRQIFLTSDL